MERVVLDLTEKPLEAVCGELVKLVRVDAAGAKSLAQVLVVVPTAQSGRRLRLELARRLGALVPPVVVQGAQLLLSGDEDGLAGRTDEIRAFRAALGEKGTLDTAAQLSDIRGVLGADALSFADVAERIGGILADEETADFEIARWRELAALEERYLAALKAAGKTDRIAKMKATLAAPPVLPGVETIVLACVLDPLPALRRMLSALAERDGIALRELSLPAADAIPPGLEAKVLAAAPVIPCATSAAVAEKVAAIFAAVAPTEALPALSVAYREEFPEIQGALQAKGLKVHDPSCRALATSSLGHLVEQLSALKRTRSYNVFSAFIRSGDVRRWLSAELRLKPEEYVAALNRLDNAQAKLLPEKIDDIGPKTDGKLRAIFEQVDACLRKKGVRQLLEVIFRDRLLDEREADSREFAAAAEAVNGILDECGEDAELFAFRLREATYSLEPDEGEVVQTDGWLELPFLKAEEIVLTGFNEGRVPEAVVGHAFLPDRLRRGLGLADNAARAQRDRRILVSALACRAPGAVKVFFRALDAAGDVLKPSRLLFAGADDAALVERVQRFYGIRAGTAEARSPDLPEAWRLKLEIPPARQELAYTSPSSLDLYLHCPFTYCLKKTFGEKEDDRAEELDPSEFGTLAHDALERWGAGARKDSEDPGEIAAELAELVDALLGERFGTAVPAIVALQGESLKRRLAAFAVRQAARHAEGWRIVATERKLKVRYGHTTVSGRTDRIDFNERTKEWCVIDYKTFDRPEQAVWRDSKQGWRSLQLPLYCAMLDADAEFPEAKRERITSVYCVLGKTPEATFFSEPMSGAYVPEAEAKVRELIDRIERGVFWPPSATNDWQWDFADWIFNTPEESVAPAWIADQRARVRALEEEAAK